jgi:hypothetical protein
MPEQNQPLIHLVRGLEELLLAGAEGLSSWLAYLEAHEDHSLDASLAALVRALSTLAELEAADLLPILRQSLYAERARWQERALDDPAAARLRDLCSALLDWLEPQPSAEETGRTGLRRAPPPHRAAGKEPAGPRN